jgi:hypothetical protein
MTDIIGTGMIRRIHLCGHTKDLYERRREGDTKETLEVRLDRRISRIFERCGKQRWLGSDDMARAKRMMENAYND